MSNLIDMAAAKKHLGQIKTFQKVLAAVELPEFEPSGDVYFKLMDSIVSQQLSVKVADVIFERFVSLFPEKYPHPALVLAQPNFI